MSETYSSSFRPPIKLNPWVVEWLLKVFAPFKSTLAPTRRIFISRTGEKTPRTRRLLNHEEIETVATKLGFEIVSPETLSFAEQIDLFSQAEIISGTHGAGLANIIFAPKSAQILELVGPHLNEREQWKGFQSLASFLGQRATRVVGDSDDQSEFNHGPPEMYTLDPKTFTAAVEKAIASAVSHSA